MSLVSRSPVIETFSLADSTLKRAGGAVWVRLPNLGVGGGGLGWYSGMGVLFPLSLILSCLSRLENWKADWRSWRAVALGSHTHFKTDVPQLTPSQKSLGPEVE